MSRRILLADDSVTIQKVIELTFMDEDYEVTAVSNGDDALARLAELGPDLVIADVHMPGANGYQVCRRSKELRPDVPVLLLVGTFEPFDEGQARAAGANAHLKKPFDSQELLQLVGELLGPTAGAAAAAAPEPAAPELAPPPPVITAPPAFAPAAAPFAPPAAPPVAPIPPIAAPAPAAAPRPGMPATPWWQAEQPAPAAAEPPYAEPEPVWGNLDDMEEVAAPSGAATFYTPEESFALEPEASTEALGDDDAYDLSAELAVSPWDEAPAAPWSAEGAADPLAGLTSELAVPPELAAEPAPPETTFDDAPETRETPEVTEARPIGFTGFSAFETTPEERVGATEDSYAPSLEAVEERVEEHEAAHSGGAGWGAAAATATPAGWGPVADEAEPLSGRPLSDEDVDRIARRVVQLVGERAVRDVAWEVIPDLAEVIIRDRLRELESQIE